MSEASPRTNRANTPPVESQAVDEARRQLAESNRAAIEAYNRRVAEHGLLSDHAGLL